VSEPEFLHALLSPVPDSELVAHEVGRAVNNPRNDAPSLVEPATPTAEARPEQGSLL